MLPSIHHGAATTFWPYVNAVYRQMATCSSFVGNTTFPMSPGGLVNICCSDPSTTVKVANGAEDAVSLQVQQPAAGANASGSSPVSSSGFSMQVLGTPRYTILDVVETTAGSSTASSTAGGVQLSAAIPSRYCGLSVNTAGGCVSVEQVQEAELQVVTRGGHVAVRRCKATNAAISTAREPEQGGQGGHIQVGELSASVLRVNSGSGDVALSRVFGLEAELLTAGGELQVNALYGRKASLLSGGGRVLISHMSCEGLAAVDSAGGHVTVDGLEGNATILSAGGNIKVHVQDSSGRVFVDSGGGDVEAWISPAAALTLQVAAARGIQLDPALKVTGELSSTTLQGVTGNSRRRSSSSSGSSWPDQKQWQAFQQHDMTAAGAHQSSRSNSSSSSLMSDSSSGSSSSSSQNYSRLRRSADEVAGMAAAANEASPGSSTAGGSGCCRTTDTMYGAASAAAPGFCSALGGCRQAGVRQLTINAGAGTVVLKCMSWMDGIRAKVQAQHSRA